MIYKIQPALINKVVGYEASIKMIEGYDYRPTNSVYNIYSRGKLDFIPNIDAIQLQKRAKFMDIMTSVPVRRSGLIISDRLLDLINSFNIPEELQVFDAYAEHKGEKRHYNYFYVYYSHEDKIIDWNKSEFKPGSEEFKKASHLFKRDIHQLRKNYDNGIEIESSFPHKLIINEAEIKTDIFKLYFSNWGYYVSEELKNAIENSDCQGVDLIPIDQLRFEVEFQ